MKMRIGSGPNTYEWLDNWAQVPNSEGARLGWAHHGLAITESGGYQGRLPLPSPAGVDGLR